MGNVWRGFIGGFWYKKKPAEHCAGGFSSFYVRVC